MATKKADPAQIDEAMKKVEAKKAEAKKAEPAKKAAAKKAEPAKKAAPAKKPAAKKAAAKEAVYLEWAGNKVATADIVANVKAAVGKKTIKELNLYVQPETNLVYYTADGEEGKITLF